MNTSLMFSSASDLWETPQELFDRLDAKYHFTLDVCALPENAKCEHYFTPEQDGLARVWTGVCWCNPPYGRQIGKWVKKAVESAKDGAIVVMLLPSRTGTSWFHDYIYKKPGVEYEFLRGRLKFGKSQNPAPFDSMIVIFKGANSGNENKEADA